MPRILKKDLQVIAQRVSGSGRPLSGEIGAFFVGWSPENRAQTSATYIVRLDGDTVVAGPRSYESVVKFGYWGPVTSHAVIPDVIGRAWRFINRGAPV